MFKVAIPSYRRSETLRAKTWPLLLGYGFDPGEIYVSVVDDERETYDWVAEAGGNLVRTTRGVGNARNDVAAAVAESGAKWLLGVDDDLTGVLRRVNSKKLEPLPDLRLFVEQMFAEMDEAGCTLWGLYPVKNPMFMRPGNEFGLMFCIGQMFGQAVGQEPIMYGDGERDDYERTLTAYLQDGATMRCNEVCADSKVYSGAGGMQELRTVASSARSAGRLAIRFPGLVKVVRKEGRTELRLKDSRPL